jgi:hypothetical protein
MSTRLPDETLLAHAQEPLLSHLPDRRTLLMALPAFLMISSSLKSVEETNAPGSCGSPPCHHGGLRAIAQNENFTGRTSTRSSTSPRAGRHPDSIAAVAYAFSRVEWPGRNLVFFLMLSTMMIPPQALIVPSTSSSTSRLDRDVQSADHPGYFAGGAAMVFPAAPVDGAESQAN